MLAAVTAAFYFQRTTNMSARAGQSGNTALPAKDLQVAALDNLVSSPPCALRKSEGDTMISALAKSNSAMFVGALQQHLRNTPGGRVHARPFTRGFVSMQLTVHGRIGKTGRGVDAGTDGGRLVRTGQSRRFRHPLSRQRGARRTDAKRILWVAGDISENRPPLSRWHPDYAKPLKKWMQE